MADLFSPQQESPTDFSSVGASRIFNEQVVPTYNRLEALALEAGAIDLDGENAAAEQRRVAQAEQDVSFFKTLAAEDDVFLGKGAARLFGPGDEQEVIPVLPVSKDPVGPATQGGVAGEIETSSSGRVSPASLKSYLGGRIAGSKLNGFVPKDGAKYGITKGTPQEWARFFTGLAKLESSFKNSTVGDIGRFEGNSNGLFQLSPQDSLNHRLKPTKFSLEELRDPQVNADAAIAIAERLVLKDGVIAANKKGAARYWGPLRRGKNPSNQEF